MTVTLAIVAAVETVVIGYGLEKHYQTWSRTWVVVKAIFNLLKSKLKRSEKSEGIEKKTNDIQLKVRKSSLKRFGANTIINCYAKTCN